VVLEHVVWQPVVCLRLAGRAGGRVVEDTIRVVPKMNACRAVDEDHWNANSEDQCFVARTWAQAVATMLIAAAVVMCEKWERE
jgi:hypothetical protein